jgi:penicillin G amidase
MKSVRFIGLSLALILLFTAMVVYFFLKSTIAEIEGSFEIEGIGKTVEIARDKWGIPHIRASSAGDMFFAIGFVHAQDRLFQMDLSRRLAFGRLSEILGERTAAIDGEQRDQLVRDSVERSLESIPAPDMGLLRRYCDGVNAFIDLQAFPPEFHLLGYDPEKWKPSDILGVFKNMESMLASSGSELVHMRLLDALGEKNARRLINGQMGTDIIDRSELWQLFRNPAMQVSLNRERESIESRPGSNSWVIAGKRTVSGSPYLANDPHLSGRFPSWFYQIEAQSPDRELSGVTLPGVPYLIIGRNREIGWGLTAIGTDVIDYFILSVHPTNNALYRFDNHWEPFKIVRERIGVKGGKEILHEVRLSKFGPVFNSNGKTIARCSIVHRPATVLQAFVEMNLARDARSFLEGLKKLSSPALSVVFADRRGNIGYFPAGMVPIRGKGDGALPQKGEASTDLWQGFFPEEKKPLILNPEKGYIVAANNPVLPEKVLPVFSRQWDPSFRADRIDELIRPRMKLTRSDMETIQTDTLLKNAEYLIGKIENMEFVSGKALWVLNFLKNWDFKAEEGFAPYLFYRFESILSRNIFADHFQDKTQISLISASWTYRIMDYPNRDPKDPMDFAYWVDDIETPQKESFAEIVEKSLIDTFEAFNREKKTNPDNLRWENIHLIDYRHPLTDVFFLRPFFDRGPFPLKGGKESVMTGGFIAGKGFAVTHLPAFRMIIDFSDYSQSLMIDSSGQSGHFLSPFYDDQIPLYIDRKYRRMDEEGSRAGRLVLIPVKE